LLALMIEYDLGRGLRGLMRRPTGEEPLGGRPTAPYGIAIAMGAVMMLLYRALASA
jgi:hypothetical protein